MHSTTRHSRSGGPILLAEVLGTAETQMFRRLLILSCVLIVLASGFVVVLGPAKLHPPALNAAGHPSPVLPTTPPTGQGVRGYASIGPLFPLCTIVGDFGPVPDNIKTVQVVVIASTGERILSSSRLDAVCDM